MAPRDPRLLLTPESEDDEIIVSRRKLGELVRKSQDLEEENGRLREELERSREKARRAAEQKQVAQTKLEQLRTSLPVLGTDARTAAAVGIPSSRVFFRQPAPSPETRRSTGGQPGHPGTTRPRPVPNSPSVLLALKTCPRCDHALGEAADTLRHTVTDLPSAGLSIFDVEAPRYKCPGCGERVHASIPEGYRGEFGPRLKSFVAHLRVLGMPFEKVQELLHGSFGLEISVASLLAMEEGVATTLEGTYQALHHELQDSKRTLHAQGDETSMPVKGENEWIWVGTSPTLTVYHIDPTRGQDGAKALWGNYRGTMTHDGWEPYDALTEVVHQMDLVHVNRWLQKAEARHGIEPRGLLSGREPRFCRAGRPPKELLRFVEGVRARLAAEVRWVEAHPASSPGRRARRYARARASMGRFLSRMWWDGDAVRMAGSIRERLDTLYTFVRVAGVSWNSNEAEREVRVAVVHRKISAGRRTDRGAWVLERLLTVWRTWKKRDLRFWDVVMEKLGAAQAGPGPPSARPAN